MFKINNNEVVRIGGRVNQMVVNLFNQSKNNKSRNLLYISNIEAIEKPTFLTPNIKKFFNHL